MALKDLIDVSGDRTTFGWMIAENNDFLYTLDFGTTVTKQLRNMFMIRNLHPI